MHPPSPTPEKDLSKDLETFEKLPAKTRELELLRDRSEKAIGPEAVAVDRIIQKKSQPGSRRPPGSAT